jgi:hypothetical protein
MVCHSAAQRRNLLLPLFVLVIILREAHSNESKKQDEYRPITSILENFMNEMTDGKSR